MDQTLLSKEDQLKLVRLEKLVKLQQLGIDPYERSNLMYFHTIASVLAEYGPTPEDFPIAPLISGRIVAWRNMGKSQFIDLQDVTGKIQIYLNKNEMTPEKRAIFDLLDIGDIIDVQGTAFLTKTGEKSIRVSNWNLLCKAVRPLPDKFHGLTDVETIYRQRYLDLIANEESRKRFLTRSHVIHLLRSMLHDRGFIEVETPIMQPKVGGAVAEPFKTHHNALNTDLYMRIAPELYLKQLLVGGFTKIFELNRSFRNEGLSRRHNPEFTMLEAYEVGSDYEYMAGMVEQLIRIICGGEQTRMIVLPDGTEVEINLKGPWKRIKYYDALNETIPGWTSFDTDRKAAMLNALNENFAFTNTELDQTLFETRVERVTYNPTFFTHLPKELVPLAKANKEDPSVVDAFELVIGGMEIAPGYTELNDPVEQMSRFAGNVADHDFIAALEYGMPPAGGVGIGIDRLVMLLTKASSIKDVILFPHMKPV